MIADIRSSEGRYLARSLSPVIKFNKPVVVFDSSSHAIVWKTPCIVESAIDDLVSMFDTEAICFLVRYDINMRSHTYICGVRAI
jgi:hypothetical protein